MDKPASAATLVYPRVGGGTANAEASVGSSTGLSPRGRGNPLLLMPRPHMPGSIPAWAGEPSPNGKATHARVYPRVGWGTPPNGVGYESGAGLSPRGRGNLSPDDRALVGRRSIPAWAGEPHPRRVAFAARPVYPRVGGGTQVSPGCDNCYMGLSPRGRGNPAGAGVGRPGARSIPAWAGEPLADRQSENGAGVYPRVGGGTYAVPQAHRTC